MVTSRKDVNVMENFVYAKLHLKGEHRDKGEREVRDGREDP